MSDISERVQRELQRMKSRAAPSALPTESTFKTTTPLPPGVSDAINDRMTGRDSEHDFLKKFWAAMTGKKFHE